MHLAFPRRGGRRRLARWRVLEEDAPRGPRRRGARRVRRTPLCDGAVPRPCRGAAEDLLLELARAEVWPWLHVGVEGRLYTALVHAAHVRRDPGLVGGGQHLPAAAAADGRRQAVAARAGAHPGELVVARAHALPRDGLGRRGGAPLPIGLRVLLRRVHLRRATVQRGERVRSALGQLIAKHARGSAVREHAQLARGVGGVKDDLGPTRDGTRDGREVVDCKVE